MKSIFANIFLTALFPFLAHAQNPVVKTALENLKMCPKYTTLNGSPYGFSCIRKQASLAKVLIQQAYGTKAAEALMSLDLMIGNPNIKSNDRADNQHKLDPLDCIAGWYPAIGALSYDSACVDRELIRITRLLPPDSLQPPQVEGDSPAAEGWR